MGQVGTCRGHDRLPCGDSIGHRHLRGQMAHHHPPLLPLYREGASGTESR